MADTESKYSARELEIMAAVMQCLKEGIPKPSQVDIPKLAAKIGMTQGSASVTWGKIKKKLTEEDAEGGTAAPKTPGTGDTKAKKTSAKRKSTAGETGDDNENGETPSKKPRAKKAKTPVKSKDDSDEDTEAPASTPAKKAAPKKPASPKSPQVGSHETAHDNSNGNTITVDSGKTTVEVKIAEKVEKWEDAGAGKADAS